MSQTRPRRRTARNTAPSDPEWYRDAIIYELHVRSFQDSNADGIGDFRGLTSRLGYLQDLGITAIWLLPFYPSPLRDDGYDIADYLGVHLTYGTVEDFRQFLDEAHRRGLRVITELVINHTSDQHPWFQRARTSPPGDPAREFYVWSQSPERYEGARIIFQDFELSNWTWDPLAQAYYWHRFYSHQPDLNFENPAVFDAVRDVLDFWFALGVDGMRLDAVPYLIEREGTHSENLRPTHAILKRLRAHVDGRFPHRMLLAEANQWPEDAAAYFGDSDESHMVFHFPLMPRLFMAIRQEDRLPITDILAQTPAAPPGCQWALFLRNHDELTLEMVTEEERQYMYYVYASDPQARLNLGIRRRLAPLVGNDRRRIELMNMLLLSLPGTPILYYGDEIGMGDNIYLGDRNGVRTPMQWSGDRNAGFSNASAQRLFLPLIVDDQYHYQAIHVEQQAASGASLLSWMTRLIGLRRRFQAFGRGTIEFVDSPNAAVLAYVRCWQSQHLLVVANLSRFAQHTELALDRFAGQTPVELFGRTAFPEIAAEPYQLALGPHACLWFELRQPSGRGAQEGLPRLNVQRQWDEILDESGRPELEAALPRYLEDASAWIVGSRTVLAARIEDVVRISSGRRVFALLLVQVTFTTGEPQRCLLPLGCRPATGRIDGARTVATLGIARHGARREYLLYDASEASGLATALIDMARQHGSVNGLHGSLEVTRNGPARAHRSAEGHRHLQRTRRGPNALVNTDSGFVLKLFRQLDEGPNPEIELSSYLHAGGFTKMPALHGSVLYRRHDPRRNGTIGIGVIQQFVDHDGEAWGRAVAAADAFVALIRRGRRTSPNLESLVPRLPAGTNPPAAADDLIGPYLAVAHLMGRRVAELHQALAAGTTDPAFAPEPVTSLSRRSMYQRMRTLAVAVGAALRRNPELVPAELRSLADTLVTRQDDVIRVFRGVMDVRTAGQRIRCHGNLHLGQMLHVGDDIVFVDFEGEPGRPLYERRLKRSPLQDVATVVRSFHYAAHASQSKRAGPGAASHRIAGWLRWWQYRVSDVFVESYLGAMHGTGLLPPDVKDQSALLHAHLLERAFYEVGFELNRRSRWVRAPLTDIPALLAPRT